MEVSYWLKEVIKKSWPPIYPQAGPGQKGAPYPLPVLGMCIPLAFLKLEAVPRAQLWDGDEVWRASGWQMWLNPVKVSI